MTSFSVPVTLTTSRWARLAIRRAKAATVHTPPCKSAAAVQNRLTNHTNEPNQELIKSRGAFTDGDRHGFQLVLEKDAGYTSSVRETANVIRHSILRRLAVETSAAHL